MQMHIVVLILSLHVIILPCCLSVSIRPKYFPRHFVLKLSTYDFTQTGIKFHQTHRPVYGKYVKII